ncbi:hypothetical protein LRC_13750 [Ligilactobacillus ruminis ATCC 27782]|uniref:Uncharacterized protein n=2 Tax=Ligilactobacillus ruminis TaxID=1623 RepID=G2SQA1_LIGR2|nr:hypothetical protein LRC_13750 [Ligilactobacillus ruminis ATCC 27782]EFZ35200.1 hypothetical protein HMPREF0542_10651 [Ligilactobacillus ruminis ATCC 25644]EGX97491.1 hypothetical protein ANHS_1967 [Ligilactobacillus ruminis ATCC 25644]
MTFQSEKRLGKTMPQIEKPDDLQAIASLIRFFCMHDNRFP